MNIVGIYYGSPGKSVHLLIFQIFIRLPSILLTTFERKAGGQFQEVNHGGFLQWHGGKSLYGKICLGQTGFPQPLLPSWI
jgi:hypothetical protein